MRIPAFIVVAVGTAALVASTATAASTRSLPYPATNHGIVVKHKVVAHKVTSRKTQTPRPSVAPYIVVPGALPAPLRP